MSIFEKITPEEREMFDYCRFDDEEIAKASHQTDRLITIADAENILRFWSANKLPLYSLLDNKLIISKEVRIAKDKAVIEHEINDRLRSHSDHAHPFLNNFEDALRGKKLFAEEPEQPYREDYWTIQNWLLSTEALYNNRVNRSNYDTRDTVIFPSGHTVKITDGTRPLRILKKFADEFNIEGFEDFRLEHSRILNDKFMTGKLCLSIHPLDYITMSDNANNWTSCMSWKHGGAYRSGTVEMMNSPYVVVAYLSSDSTTMPIGNNTWNSKKWRELFIVHEDCICGIKGYPYASYTLEGMCMDWIAELAEKNYGWKYNEDILTYDGDTDRSICFETYQMYNDTQCNLCSIRYRKGWDIESTNTKYINYSGETVCMVCGTHYWADIEEDYDMLVCDYCSPYTYCDECGFRTYKDSLVEHDGIMYCENCVENFPVCPGCGERIFPSERTYPLYVLKDGVFRWSSEFMCCEDCLKEGKILNEDDVINVTVDSTSEWGYPTEEKIIRFEDLTDLGKASYLRKNRDYFYEQDIREFSPELFIESKEKETWISFYTINGKDYNDERLRSSRTHEL